MATPIPIIVLGGYLGAGKTTLLNELLAAADERIGVIVNDFGELGVDAELLADRAGDGLIDLPNGCVCCTLGTELGVALEAMSARRPRLDLVVIEASGVADPAALAAWGTVPGYAPGGVFVVAAADSIRRDLDDRYVGDEVRRQLDAADVIIVTKADLVTDTEFGEVLSWLTREHDAPVLGRPSSIAELVVGPRVSTFSPPSTAVTDHIDRYDRWSWTPKDVSQRPTDVGLRAFVAALPPAVLRAKGIVTADVDGASVSMLVQVVGGSRSIIELGERSSSAAADAAGGGRGLVVIGRADQTDPASLDALATTHLA